VVGSKDESFLDIDAMLADFESLPSPLDRIRPAAPAPVPVPRPAETVSIADTEDWTVGSAEPDEPEADTAPLDEARIGEALQVLGSSPSPALAGFSAGEIAALLARAPRPLLVVSYNFDFARPGEDAAIGKFIRVLCQEIVKAVTGRLPVLRVNAVSNQPRAVSVPFDAVQVALVVGGKRLREETLVFDPRLKAADLQNHARAYLGWSEQAAGGHTGESEHGQGPLEIDREKVRGAARAANLRGGVRVVDFNPRELSALIGTLKRPTLVVETNADGDDPSLGANVATASERLHSHMDRLTQRQIACLMINHTENDLSRPPATGGARLRFLDTRHELIDSLEVPVVGQGEGELARIAATVDGWLKRLKPVDPF
jgi:hypothetical protein